ncbi:MAG: GDP-L-fucose synthase [Hydrogenophaga sp.]|uniref:GDP-L-fucose synthase family protein n=1 Tax=Hydrogenophaga sp. TaxID=1904254 RepID=UPI002630A497|nr:GDP-L-fucose synthase [Hydrogenophaga sp.]MCV0439789.1 GDP-L-fucose synthase [Hydrogenophaga sp.]
MTILITGAHGFVGKHVVDLLQRGEEHILTPQRRELDLLNSSEWPLQHPDANINLRHYIKRNNVDTIVHLAATCGGIGINKDNPGSFIHQNLQMGINVLEAARQTGVKKVVNLGTVCAYPKFAEVPFREETIWNGYPEETNAPYGIAKKTIMEMGIAYATQYGMDITNLVPVNMAGEYDNFDLYSSHVIPALIRKFEEADGKVTLWGTGSASREFLYAGDCARAIGVALKRSVGPQPINLGTGEEITIRDLAELIQRIGEYDVEIEWDSTKPDGQPRRCLDVTRAKNVLRWEAQTSLEETLSRTISWYRSNA